LKGNLNNAVPQIYVGCSFVDFCSLVFLLPGEMSAHEITEEIYKEVHSKVLHFIVTNQTTDLDKINNIEGVRDLQRLFSKDSKRYRDYYLNLDANNHAKKPKLLYEQVVVDGAPVDIYVYPDGSFVIISITIRDCMGQVVESVKVGSTGDNIIPQSTKRIISEWAPGTSVKSISTRYTIWGVVPRRIVLNNDVSLTPGKITISSTNTSGSYGIYPMILNGATSWVSQNRTNPAKSHGEYTFTQYLVAYPAYSFSEGLRCTIYCPVYLNGVLGHQIYGDYVY
jgi:hypothetical protein